MTRLAASLASLALALAVAGCGRKPPPPPPPATVAEAMKAAEAAFSRGEWSNVLASCERALELADKEGSGGKALLSLECMQDAAGRMKPVPSTLKASEIVMGKYAQVLRGSAARHRIPNNHAVMLHAAGRRDEAAAVLSEAIDADAGTGFHSSGDFRARVVMIRNLARASMDSPHGPLAEWIVREALPEVEARLDPERHGLHANLGVGDAMAAIARLAEKRGAATFAAQVSEKAEARIAEETAFIAGRPDLSPYCPAAPLHGREVRACFQSIP
jgi:predicted small lipoprotein YifL